MIAAALFTTRSLETSASTNFPGVVSSASPEYFNFVGQAPLTSVDVSPGETVVAGQILATQDNTVQAAAVVKDNMLLASDEQALAALLGQSGQLAATEAAALLTKASSVSLADEQRGSSSVAEGEGQVAAAEAQLTTDQGQLAADQAAYRSQCPAGVGRGCQSLSRDIAFDQSAVAQATTHVGVAQQGLNRDQGLEGTLLKLAQQVQQEASAATPNVLPAVIQGIRQAREAVANDVYQLAVDQGNLAATELVAPFPGRVIGVYATDGEIVGSAGTRQGSSSQSPVVPGASASNVLAPSSPSNSSAASQPFISINATTMDAVAQVPEAQVSAVRVGEAATVTVNALSGSSAILHAKVSSIGLQPVQVNGAVFYDVTVVPSIGTWPSTVLSGMTANIAIP
jgi:macrolide-specific efflux system membrane fusion protein